MPSLDLPSQYESDTSFEGQYISFLSHGPSSFLRSRNKKFDPERVKKRLQRLSRKSSTEDSSTNANSDTEGYCEGDQQPDVEGSYEMERVLARQTIEGEEHYYIKWTSWPYSSCSWEPTKNVVFGGSPVKEFLKREEMISVIMQNPSLRFKDSRLYQLRNLDRWEQSINKALQKYGRGRTFVYNDVDVNRRPKHFQYICESVISESVKRPSAPPPRRRCSCDRINSSNGFDPKGRRYTLAIVRTKQCGWGVFAMEDIPKNAWICEFVGEILPLQEANRRRYVNYQYDLTCEDLGIQYVVDAKHMGNESAFMNHSCRSNVETRILFDKNAPPAFHRMGFFSKTKIFKGDELTLDYFPDVPKDGTKIRGEEKTKQKCRCGQKRCMKYFPRGDIS